MLAEFPEKEQLISFGNAPLSQYIPPPFRALFPAIMQLVSVGEERRQYTPPPSLEGRSPEPPLSLIVQFANIG
ncbi:MAG TPA: hypothetical protein PK395_10745, partial [bacterium]|nr:hypothetical protein [bacterium]